MTECSFGGVGAKIELDLKDRLEFVLFHEGPSRMIVATSNEDAVQAVAAKYRLECLHNGETMRDRLQIRTSRMKDVTRAWKTLG